MKPSLLLPQWDNVSLFIHTIVESRFQPHCNMELSTQIFIFDQRCSCETYNAYFIHLYAHHQITYAKSVCQSVYITHLLTILVLSSFWINKITRKSSIVSYLSFSMPAALLCLPNPPSCPFTVILVWWIFCRHDLDECMKGKLYLQYCLIGGKLGCCIYIK